MGIYNPINQVDREYGEGSGGGRGGGGRGSGSSGSSGIQVNPNKRVYGFGDLSSGGEGQNSDNKNGTAQETPSHVRLNRYALFILYIHHLYMTYTIVYNVHTLLCLSTLTPTYIHSLLATVSGWTKHPGQALFPSSTRSPPTRL